jgi:phage terminase large subunit GpA-like protein
MLNYDSFKVHCPHCGEWSSPDIYAETVDPDWRVPHTVPVRVAIRCGSCEKHISASWAMIDADWRIENG